MSREKGHRRRGRSGPFSNLYDDHGTGAQFQYRDLRDDFDNGYSDDKFHDASSTSQKPITQLLEKSSHRERPGNSPEGMWSSPNNLTCGVTKQTEEECICNVFKNTDPDDDYVYNENLEVDGESRLRQREPFLYIYFPDSEQTCTDPRCLCCSIRRSLTDTKSVSPPTCNNPGCMNCAIRRSIIDTNKTKTGHQKVKETSDEKVEKQSLSVRDKLETSSGTSRERTTTFKYSNSSYTSNKEASGHMPNTIKENENLESKNISADNEKWINTENKNQEKTIVHEIDLDKSEREHNESNEVQKQKDTHNSQVLPDDIAHDFCEGKRNEQKQHSSTVTNTSPNDPAKQGKWNETNGSEDQKITDTSPNDTAKQGKWKETNGNEHQKITDTSPNDTVKQGKWKETNGSEDQKITDTSPNDTVKDGKWNETNGSEDQNITDTSPNDTAKQGFSKGRWNETNGSKDQKITDTSPMDTAKQGCSEGKWNETNGSKEQKITDTSQNDTAKQGFSKGKWNETNGSKDQKITDTSPKDTAKQGCSEGKWNETNGSEDHKNTSGTDVSTFINDKKSEKKYRRDTLASNSSGSDNDHDLNYTKSFSDDSYKRKHSETSDFADDLYYDDLDYYDAKGSYYEDKNTVADKPTKATEDMSMKTSQSNDDRYVTGEKQWYNMPIFKKSIRKFAQDNGFEIRDGVPDGNCMFRAIVDQMRINGDFCFTPHSLRRHAISYLRKNPYNTDGSHLESFISTETWSEYLMRMEKTSQWGDHIMLKAISDALHLVVVVFNVYDDDIRRTEIQPVRSKTWWKPICIHLGHIGEFHYLSLRKSNWETVWPYRAVIQRLHAYKSENRSEDTELCIQQKIKQMGIRGYIEEAEITPSKWNLKGEKSLINSNDGDTKTNDDQVEVLTKSKTFMERKYPSVKTYGLQKLQLEESEESFRLLLEDPLHIDVLTGIPIPHLSFIIKVTVPMELVTIVYRNIDSNAFESMTGFDIINKGSSIDGTNVFFFAATKDNEMQYYHGLKKSKKIKMVYCFIDYEVVYSGASHLENFDNIILADTSSTYPGYCRLLPFDTRKRTWGNQIYHEESTVYLKGWPKIGASITHQKYVPERIFGFKCVQFPPCARAWEFRDRPSSWPPKSLIDEIILSGCTVIQASHPSSGKPTIEWEFIFTQSEQILLQKGLQESQKHAFYVFKIIVEYMTRHLTKQLENKHFKSIFFYANESIPQDAWEHSFGGCIMYLCSKLLEGLRKKFIHHYFILTRNLLDGYTDEEIETISVLVEAIRHFPMDSINFMLEKHGFYTLTRINSILNDSSRFSEDKDLNRVFMHVFLPCLMQKLGQSLDFGFYRYCYGCIKDIYEALLITPASSQSFENRPSFEVFFKHALRTLKDNVIKENLTRHYEKDCGKEMLCQNENKKYVKDFFKGPMDEKVGSTEVPNKYSDDMYSVAIYLDDLSLQFYRLGNGEMAFRYVKEAIRFIRQELADGIDVSEITDKSLKDEICRQQKSRVTQLNENLCDFYQHMFQACLIQGRLEKIREYMTEMEDACKRVPSLKCLVSRIWKSLGDTERSLLFKTG